MEAGRVPRNSSDQSGKPIRNRLALAAVVTGIADVAAVAGRAVSGGPKAALTVE